MNDMKAVIKEFAFMLLLLIMFFLCVILYWAILC